MKHCKRLVSLALAFVLVLGLVPSGLADLLPVSKVNAANAAVTINTATEWETFANNNNTYSGQLVVLGADITLSGEIPSKLNFRGTFDGQGHIITIATDSSIVAPEYADNTNGGQVESLGLFGTLENATVSDLVIRFSGSVYGSSLRAARLSEGNNAYVGTLYYGILAGTAAGSTIRRVAILNDGSAIYKVVVNHFTYYDVNVGALVGRLFRTSRIEQCYNGVDVFGYRYTPTNRSAILRAGGIAGFVGNQSVITDCINYGGTASTYHSNPEQQSNLASQAAGIAATLAGGSSISNCIFEVGAVRTEDITDSRLVADQSVDDYLPLNTGYYVGTAGYIYAFKEADCSATQIYAYNGVAFGRTGIQMTDNVTTGTDAESKAKQALIGDGSVWVENTNSKLSLAWMVQTPKITLQPTANDTDVTVTVTQADPVAPRNVETTEWEYTVQGALMGRLATPAKPEVVTGTTVSVRSVSILESRTDGAESGKETYYSGGEYQFYAQVTGNNITEQNTTVTWSLPDVQTSGTGTAAATISAAGLLKVSENYFGTLKIRAESGGKSSEKTITVLPAKLEITTAPGEAAQGGTADFAATVSGCFAGPNLTDTPYKVKWSVSGGTQAGTTINDDGTLTVDAAEAEDTELTVTASLTPKNEGDLTSMTEEDKALLPTATATITVTKALPEEVSLSLVPAETAEEKTVTLTVGQRLKLSIGKEYASYPVPEGYEYKNNSAVLYTPDPTTILDHYASGGYGAFETKSAGEATITATLTLTYNKIEDAGDTTDDPAGEGGEDPGAATPPETVQKRYTSKVTVTVNPAPAAPAPQADTLSIMTSVKGSKATTEISSTAVSDYSFEFPDAADQTRWYKLTTTENPSDEAIADWNWTQVDNDSRLVKLTGDALSAIRGNGAYLWMFTGSSDDTIQTSSTVGWKIQGENVTPVDEYPAEEALAYQSSVSVSGTWTVKDGKVQENGGVFSALELLRGGQNYTSLAEGEVRVTVRQKSGLGTYWPREGEFLTETTASVAIGDAALMPTIQPRTGKLPNNKFSITVPAQENVEVYYKIYKNRSAGEISPTDYPSKQNGDLYDVGVQKEIAYSTGGYEKITVIAITYPKGDSGGRASDPDIVTYTTENLIAPDPPELVIGENEMDFVGSDLYDEGQIFKFRFAANQSGGEPYQVYYTVNGKDPNIATGAATLYDPDNPPTMAFGLFTELEIRAIVYDPNYKISSSVASYTVQKISSAAKPAASITSGSTVRPSEVLTLELGADFVDSMPNVSGFESAMYAEYSEDSEVFAQYEDYVRASNSETPIEGMRYLIVDSGSSISSLELPTIRYSTNETDVLEDVGAAYQYAVCQVWYEITQEKDEETGQTKDVATRYIRFTNPDEIILSGVAGDKLIVRAAMYPPSGVTSYLASGEITYTYTIRGSVSAPTAIPGSDTAVNIGAPIALSGDVNTEIYYTVDGSTRPAVTWVEDADGSGRWEPANEQTKLYNGDISVPYTKQTLFILRAIAVSADDTLEPSEMVSFTYTVNPLEKAAAPTASPVTDAADPTRLANGERITLTTTTLDTDIYYTTDGSVPSYDARITWDAAYAAVPDEEKGETNGVRWYTDGTGWRVSEPSTYLYDTQKGVTMAASGDSEFFFVTAVAVDKNRDLPTYEVSDAVSFVYRLAQVETPAASPVTSESSVSVIEPGTTITLTSATAGAEIYFTKDGTAPDVTDTAKVKAEYAEWLAGWNAAADAGRGCDSKGVRWYTDADGARHDEPSTIPYDTAEGIVMPNTITTFFRLRVVAVVSDGSRSASTAATFSYQLPAPVQAVYASPVGDSAVEYGSAVTLSCSTEGAQIFYKIYTSEPAEDDAPVVNQDLSYTEPITVSKEIWIRAVATKSGMESAVTTYHYTVAPTADAPTISLPTGSVVPKGTRVMLTGEGTIVYTLDGSDPKAADSAKQYGSAVNLDGEYGATITVRAYIQRDGYTPSDTVSFSYTLCKEEDYLKISVENGSVIASGASVTLSTAITNGQIFYTLDGSTPQVKNVYTAADSKNYTTYEWASAAAATAAGSGFTLTGNPDASVTVRAIVVVNGGSGGQVSTFTYKFQPRTASPTASIPSGAVVFDGAAVELSAKEGVIYYTLDGTDPTTSSSIYSEPVDVSGAETVVLKAMAVVENKANSAVVEFRYTRAGQVGTPVFSVTPGEIDTGTAVAITSATAGAAIYYSTDGTKPTADNLSSLTLYVAPISVTRAVTIRAIAVSDTMDPSDVAEATYTVREPVVEPEQPQQEQTVTETVTDRLTSRRTYNAAGDGPTYSDIVLRESVCNTVLSAKAGALPDGTVLTVTQEASTRSDEAAVEAALGQSVARVYAAELTLNGDAVVPTGTVELGFAIPAEYQNGVVSVSRINDDGTLTQYVARRSGGMAYIETDSLGRFALSVPQQSSGSGIPAVWLVGGGMALVLAFALLIALAASRRRRRADAAAASKPYEDLADFQNFDRK